MGADQPQLGRITTLLKPVFGDLFRDMMLVNAVESTTAQSLLVRDGGLCRGASWMRACNSSFRSAVISVGSVK